MSEEIDKSQLSGKELKLLNKQAKLERRSTKVDSKGITQEEKQNYAQKAVQAKEQKEKQKETQVQPVQMKQPKQQENIELPKQKLQIQKHQSINIAKTHSIISDLTQFEHLNQMPIKELMLSYQIHPIFQELSLKFKNDFFIGSNQRSTAVIKSLQRMIQDYQTPPDALMQRDLQIRIDKVIEFYKQIKIQLDDGIITIFKFVKYLLSFITHKTQHDNAKNWLIRQISDFHQKKIVQSRLAIVNNNIDLIQEGETILTYGYSTVILELLNAVKLKKISFKVVVCDAEPLHEGREMLTQLSQQGISCVYTLLNTVPQFMTKATKVLLGATSILVNGSLVSRCGTSMVACIANQYRVPVIAFCESYKMSERSQLDAFSYNELIQPIKSFPDSPNQDYYPVDLRWDLTPSNLIQMIITELGKIPATSVPVILRELKKVNYMGAIEQPHEN